MWIGCFDFLDDSVLGAVLRGTASLLHPRRWVAPNRRRPTQLRLTVEQPLLLFPRNAAACDAADEARLRAASVWCEAERVEVCRHAPRISVPPPCAIRAPPPHR